MSDIGAELSAYKAQRDHIMSIIASDPDAADSSLEELVCSLTELIVMLEVQNAQAINEKENEDERSALLGVFDEDPEDPTDIVSDDPSLSVSHTDLSSAEAELHSCLLHLQCRVPFQHSWGQMRYSNAMVQSVESTPVSDGVDEVHVRLLFLQPTHRSMVPCDFFLDGKCRFDAKQCHFSHGEVYPLSKLKQYQPPDFDTLRVGSTCLCAGEDGIWEHGTVTEIKEGTEEGDETEVSVRFTGRNDKRTVKIQQIVPDPSDTLHTDGDISLDGEPDGVLDGSDVESEDEFAPHVAWDLPVQRVSEGFAGWENHTKGVGSRLMAKMGFIVGQGLGMRAEGRTEPVPAHVLPKGRSLDYCMALKEGKKLPAVGQKRRNGRKAKRRSQPEVPKSKKTLFDFINANLKEPNRHRRKAAAASAKVTASSATSSGSADVTDPGKQLNLEALKLHDRISGLTKDLNRLRSSLSRNAALDRAAAKVISQRIKAKEMELADLRRGQDVLQKTKDKQKEKKALAIF